MLVSVIIPTHNRENLISNALDSVIRQTYRNLEIIVVSDGSTDNTSNILEKYQEKDQRIKFISYYPNKGGNYARNIGIKNASGDYIAFLDDDDEWMHQKIELQVEKMRKNNNLGLVYTGSQTIYDNLNITYNTLPRDSGDLSKEILIGNLIGTTSSVLIKSAVLKKSGLFDEKLKARQDYDLWIRICQISEIGYIGVPLIKYYNSIGTKQISDDVNKYIDAIKYLEIKYKMLYQELDKKRKKKYSLYCESLIVNKYIRNNENKLARGYLLKQFKTNPKSKQLLMYFSTFFKFETALKIRKVYRYR